MKVLDLFSGIGGFSLGFERAGMKTVAFCEIDNHCHKVLKKNWPKVPIITDVKMIDGQFIKSVHGKIDVICGGFPCQDISVAGKGKGFFDEEKIQKIIEEKNISREEAINELGDQSVTRSGLWFEFKRIINEVRPKYVIIENVANLRNKGLVTILKDLMEIGYDAEWDIISARSVGAPHLRERIWIVAYSNSNTLWNQSERTEIRWNNIQQQREGISGDNGKKGCTESSNSNHFRFWPSFTTEKEKQQWWTETTAGFCDWWEAEPTICRVDDGLPSGLDKGRAQRIKQLGNSIVPQIAELIGKRIMEVES